ncbi:MAG: T9SS type A sorting domain-containing protein [Bacteroidota bacterium]|nr:T9SS type A sorting domain-containing protein [Bacteroidota bacterium]
MKNLLFAFLIAVCTTASAQAPLSNEKIAAAIAEGKSPAELAALIEYYNTKGTIQPAQRNPNPVAIQTMANPGFETGDFTGWTGYIGDNNLSSLGPLQNVQAGFFSTIVDDVVTSSARHTIVTNNYGPDPYGNFLLVPAGMGNYTVRLGGITPNYQGEIIEQTFMVDAGTPYIKISYAAVLWDGGHPADDSPYFRYSLVASNGDTIASHYTASADSTLIPYSSNPDVRYLPWVTDSAALSAYIGMNVKLRFTVAGCTQSGHWGYGYVHADYPYVTSIREESSFTFSLSPNPGSGIFNVLTIQPQSGNETIVVTDILGQELPVNATQNGTGWKIDMSSTTPGIYFVELRSGENRSVQRLIVE